MTIWQIGANCDDSRRLYFSRKDDGFQLTAVYRHTPDGSFVWTERTLSERKYTSERFSDVLTFWGEYPSLAPVLPVPQ